MEIQFIMTLAHLIQRAVRKHMTESITTTVAAVAMFVFSALPLLADATGYKVVGNAGLQISVTGNTTSMTVIATNADDCAALGNGVAAIARICEKMDKDGTARLNFSGSVRPVDQRTVESRVDLGAGGVPVDLRLMTAGNRIAIAQISIDGGPSDSILTLGERGQYDQLEQTTAAQPWSGTGGTEIVGYRLGAFTVAEVRLTPREFGQSWQFRFSLDAKVEEYGYTNASDDCYRAVSETDYYWGRQCEKATKDGAPFEFSGVLKPFPGRRDAFSGRVSDANGLWTWQVMVVNPTERKFDVAISEQRDTGFLGQYQLLEFDTMARPRSQTPPDPAPSGLPSENWRLPQEELADIGFDLEAVLAPSGNALNGNAILWFRAETDQISGHCPSTQAMLQICERIQKDGPLEMQIALTERVANVSHGWRGTATPVGWGFGPYDVDFFKGVSIADWGAQEAQSWYMRFRAQGVPPGGEALAWLKVVTMDRPPVTLPELEARGTFDRPATMQPPSGSGQAPQGITSGCEALDARIAGLSGPAERQRVSAILSGAGFWGGFVPTTDEECDRALALLDQAGIAGGGGTVPAPTPSSPAWKFGDRDIWPDSTTVIRAPVKGPGEYSFELTSDAYGQPILRIPAFQGCYQQGALCQLFQANPGTYLVSRVANSPEVLIGQFNVAGDLFAIRLERGQGGTILTYISRIEAISTMGLGPAEIESP